MNIFITGVKGFIGLHLQKYLQFNNSEYELFTPSSEELNLIDEDAVDRYIIFNKIDIIIHLANRGGDRTSVGMKDIVEYNLRIFFNIMKHEKSVKKIISFGSGAEYAKHKAIVDAKEEDYLSEQPGDAYGFYKSITSKYIEKSTNAVQLRIFGAYGEKEDYRFKFISNAIVKNLLELPIVVNKNVYFDYIYIDDLVRMITWFIVNDAKEKIYNVTSGTKVDLVSLANIVNENSVFQSDIKVLNSGLNNEYTSSNEKVLREIGSFTFTSHKEAILKMQRYFKENIQMIDKEVIINDPYLKKINTMWKKES